MPIRTQQLNKIVVELRKKEVECGALDIDPSIPSTITAFPAGYIDKGLETIVGLMTDNPLKRSIKPLESYGYTPDADLERIYTEVGQENVWVWVSFVVELHTASTTTEDVV